MNDVSFSRSILDAAFEEFIAWIKLFQIENNTTVTPESCVKAISQAYGFLKKEMPLYMLNEDKYVFHPIDNIGVSKDKDTILEMSYSKKTTLSTFTVESIMSRIIFGNSDKSILNEVYDLDKVAISLEQGKQPILTRTRYVYSVYSAVVLTLVLVCAKTVIESEEIAPDSNEENTTDNKLQEYDIGDRINVSVLSATWFNNILRKSFYKNMTNPPIYKLKWVMDMKGTILELIQYGFDRAKLF